MQADDDTPRPKPRPGRAPEAEAREAERRRRLAAALRDNLKRRKTPGADRGKPATDAQEP